ncbi:MAG: TolC family protein [Treponema sp.]|nr:TolC family protein [Treponema sp.]
MKKLILLFSVSLIVSFGLFAQTINLEQARVLALANSRSLAKYELSIRSSVLDERNQLFSMLPSVSMDYNASMSYLKDWEFINPFDTFSTGVTLSVTQIIFQGGKSFLQKSINAIATESVRKDALAEYFKVLDELDSAYYTALESSATLEAEEASLQTVSYGFSVAEIRLENGMINYGDYLKALADKESRENSRNQARRNYNLNIAKLKNLTGITGNIELAPVDFNVYEEALQRLALISDDEADILYEKLWKIITASNPSLAKAAISNHRAEMNFSITKRDYAPTISATVFSTGLNYSAADGFRSSSSGGLTIRGSIPLDFWVLGNRLEKSKIARDSAALDFIGAEISLDTELQTALLNAFAQAGSVLSSRRSLEYTQKHLEFVMERYRLSQSSVSDLSEATSLFINSRNSQTKASYSFLQSLSRLRSLGAFDDEAELLKILVR